MFWFHKTWSINIFNCFHDIWVDVLYVSTHFIILKYICLHGSWKHKHPHQGMFFLWFCNLKCLIDHLKIGHSIVN